MWVVFGRHRYRRGDCLVTIGLGKMGPSDRHRRKLEGDRERREVRGMKDWFLPELAKMQWE